MGKQIRLGAEDNAPAARGAQAATPFQPVQGPEPAPASIPRVEPAARVTQTQTVPRLVFVKLAPSSPEVSLGSRVTVTTSVENAQDAHTLSCSLSFDPKVLKLVNVQDAGFMGQDGKTINLAPKIENETGGATILLSRPPGSPGVNGNGILVNLVFETIGTGVSPISFMKASIMDAAQANLPTSSSGTQITVK